MNEHALTLGILPLLFFVIVDSFLGLKWALIVAIFLAIAEAIGTYFYFGELDGVTLFSLISVILLAYTSYKSKNETFFKFQPVLVSAAMGGWLMGSYFLGEPLLLAMVTKYKGFLPQEFSKRIGEAFFNQYLSLNTFSLGVAFLIHGGVTAYSALKLSNWWWLGIRGIGFYIFMALAIMGTNLFLQF